MKIDWDNLANAWEQGWLAAYWSGRGYEAVEGKPFPTPEHLTEDLIEWNPYRMEGGADE